MTREEIIIEEIKKNNNITSLRELKNELIEEEKLNVEELRRYFLERGIKNPYRHLVNDAIATSKEEYNALALYRTKDIKHIDKIYYAGFIDVLSDSISEENAKNVLLLINIVDKFVINNCEELLPEILETAREISVAEENSKELYKDFLNKAKKTKVRK